MMLRLGPKSPQLSHVSASDIEVTVVPASVRITITISASATAVTGIEASLRPHLTSAGAASALLAAAGVTVEHRARQTFTERDL